MDKTNYLLDKVSQIESELQLQAQINLDTQEKNSTLTTNIEQLSTNLDNNVDNLLSQISSETNARQNADSTLQSAITSETNTRATADNNLQTQISANTTAISTEKNNRTDADSTLQSNIDAEASTRASADTNLQTQITTNKSNISNKFISGYGTCSTAASTATKIVTIADTNWQLKVGTIIGIYFSTSNTASNVTLNVNNTGAKSIWYNNSKYTGNNTCVTGVAGSVIFYMYNGTYWVWLSNSSNLNTDTIPAISWTASATATKTASYTSYQLLAKSYFNIVMTYANTSKTALTLNVNSNGAKPIYINGVASSTTNYTLPAGSYFVYYDGTNYYFRTDGFLQTNGIAQKVNVTKGTSPSSNQWTNIARFFDNNGKALSGIENGFLTDKTNKINMICYRGTVDDTSVNTQIGCGFDGNGNWFTYAPTPATTDNSTKIATTAFVNNKTDGIKIQSEVVWSGNVGYLSTGNVISVDLSKYKYAEFITGNGNILLMDLQTLRDNSTVVDVYTYQSSYYNNSWHDGVKAHGLYDTVNKKVTWDGHYCALYKIKGIWWENES